MIAGHNRMWMVIIPGPSRGTGRFMLEYFLVGRLNATPCGLAVGANAPPSILHGFSQHEVFENEIAVAAGK
jgi:hypothetical protein